MEITIHPKSNLKSGDYLRIDSIHDNRLDMLNLKMIKSASVTKIPNNKEIHDNLIIVCENLLNYCKGSPLNFQFEKLGDYLRDIENILTDL
jgi:hypothetical protein